MKALRVMIVEDEYIIAVNIAMMVKIIGHTVTSICASGENALNKADVDKPDIILMDIKLNGKLNGIETASLIQSKTNIFVLFITSFSGNEVNNKIKEYLSKIKHYNLLHKPIEPYQLKVAIENAISDYSN